jgi:hypothetical protein
MPAEPLIISVCALGYSLPWFPLWDLRDISHALRYSFRKVQELRYSTVFCVHFCNSSSGHKASKHIGCRESENMMTKSDNRPRLDVDEVRLIADLRIMHSKVHELFEVISVLKRGREENFIRQYADHAMLEKDIQRVDEIYLWFVRLKEEGLRLKKK